MLSFPKCNQNPFFKIDIILNSVLDKLRTRVLELISECNYARNSYRALHKDRSRLEKIKETEMVKIDMLNSKATSLQLHKFGREVDLDTLDNDSQDDEEDPADVNARANRESSIKNIEKLEQDSDKLKDRLAEVTKVNTDLLKTISALLEQKAKINSDLKAPGSDVLQDNTALMQEEEAEMQRMVQQVTQQANEIEIMKSEIVSLKRKQVIHPIPDIPVPSGGSGMFPPIPKSKKTP